MIAVDVRAGEILDVVVGEDASRGNTLFKQNPLLIKMKVRLAEGGFDDKEISITVMKYHTAYNKNQKDPSPKFRDPILRKCIGEIEKIEKMSRIKSTAMVRDCW